MEIRYLRHNEIDKTKWNSCVHFSPNGNIFGYKWYLDNVAKEWDALVENDYESVMPLPIRSDNLLKTKKLYQPDLIRELGIFSINVLSPKRISAFLEKIPEELKSIQINLNERIAPFENLGFSNTKRVNHQLYLNSTYPELADKFSRDLLLKLEQAELNRVQPNNQLKPEKIADFYKKHSPNRKNLEQNFHALQRIMWNALHRGWGFSSAVLNQQKEILAANFFLISHNKLVSLIPLESPEGKEKGALPYLFNMILRTSAGKSSILDFNTVKKDELALSFGAKENAFYQIAKDTRKIKLF